MKRIMSLSLLSALILLNACGTGQETKKETPSDSLTTMTADSTASKTYDKAMVDNKKDPSCGMPVSAGINDTAHYDNHVIGFCSTECKNEFLKNPKAGLAAAELNK